MDRLAYTFDDLLLRPGYAELLLNQVNIETFFSRNIPLKIPIVSAAMDTVTEYELAIELAKAGGIGVIHRNLDPETQALHVARVKHHLNGLIEKPICVYKNQTIEQIKNMREQKGYGFHSFPVINPVNRSLVGILTGNDFEFCSNISQTAEEVMSTKVLTGSTECTFAEAYQKMREEKIKVLPLIDNEGKIHGMYVLSDVKRIIEGNIGAYNVDSKNRLRVAAAIGVREDAFERLEILVAENVDVVVIDTAHADSRSVIETLKDLKKNYDLDIVVGNISMPESAKRLADAGADGIKVGQGPGSICTTRVVSGAGRPQISAIYDCAKAIELLNIPICADGGIRYSGDITKAIAAGAHSVMLGSLLAGTEESPGETVPLQGKKWKDYRGMGSLGAMLESKGSRSRYLQDSTEKKKLVPEGVEGLVLCKGKLADKVLEYTGGLRSGMGYVGAASIEELREKGDFDRITDAGKLESKPHGILITKEAPNYREED